MVLSRARGVDPSLIGPGLELTNPDRPAGTIGGTAVARFLGIAVPVPTGWVVVIVAQRPADLVAILRAIHRDAAGSDPALHITLARDAENAVRRMVSAAIATVGRLLATRHLARYPARATARRFAGFLGRRADPGRWLHHVDLRRRVHASDLLLQPFRHGIESVEAGFRALVDGVEADGDQIR